MLYAATLALLALCVSSSLAATLPTLFPTPTGVTPGSPLGLACLSPLFAFSLPPDDILTAAATRALARLPSPPASGCNSVYTLVTLSVSVTKTSSEVPLQLGVDESYDLKLDTSKTATITAPTVWGALHGIQTFLQLVTCHSSQCTVPVPVSISDVPRKPHRGVMLDTARHFLSVATIEQTMDAMERVKMNALHLHLTDAQSTPLQSKAFPNLSKGAYSAAETFSASDLSGIVAYGIQRGIRVVPEVDVPGHAYAFGIGYPSSVATCPPDLAGNINNVPLDVSSSFTLSLVTQLYRELAGVFVDQTFHAGGDEVVFSCWTGDPAIDRWLKEHGLTPGQAFTNFVSTVDANLTAVDRAPVHWWNSNIQAAASHLPSDTLFQVWKSLDEVPDAVATGHRVIVSPSSSLYLNCGFNPGCAYASWQDVYATDIEQGVPAGSTHLVVGAEAVMFGEFADDTCLSVQVWPRAAALAQSLWYGTGVAAADLEPMLHDMRCRLVAAGVPAAPVGPGYCEDTGSV